MNAHDKKACRRVLIVPNCTISHNKGQVCANSDQIRFFNELLERLGHLGLASFVLEPYRDHQVPISGKPGFQFYHLGRFREEFGAFAKIWAYVKASLHLWRAVGNYDVIYAFLPGYLGALAGLYTWIRRKTFAAYVRGGLEHGGPILHDLYLRLTRQARFVLCTGPVLRDEVRRSGGHAELVRPMTSFGIKDIVTPCIRPNKEELRLLFVGTVSRSKGVFDLLEAFRLFDKPDLQLRLRIVGAVIDESDARELRKLLTLPPLNERVTLLGYVSDPEEIREHYLWADVFTFPSSYNEGFPRVVYEAMIFGVPIVMYDLPVVAGFMKNKKNCLIVPLGNTKAFCGALYKIADSRLRQHLALKASRDVDALFKAIDGVSHAEQVHARIKQQARESNSVAGKP
jgi:glycosyltransferase involved in cell wall biosynthesis